jgi:chemotaxis family two-component system sensor kinase Cph1
VSSDAKPAYDSADLLLFQIVHDVRALLRKSHTRTQILQQQIEPLCDDSARGFFDEVLSSQRELDQLMVRLAAYAEAGRAASREWINLDVAILGAKLQMKNALEQAGAELAASDTAGVRAPAAIQSVLAELIANSIRFRDPARPLRIAISTSASPAGDRRRIRVSDNGPGWNPRHSERMFEPLRKLDGTPDGFGLGLAIARRVVEGFGGRICAESDSTGGVFLIDIPDDDGSVGDS